MDFSEDRSYIRVKTLSMEEISEIFKVPYLPASPIFEIRKDKHIDEEEVEEFYILRDLRDENNIDKSVDPFSIMINQFYRDVLFDILEFLPKKYYEDYFNALSLLHE
jgi:Mg2+ and Co2+ transporter CorA